jgi:hypothetical protein
MASVALLGAAFFFFRYPEQKVLGELQGAGDRREAE